MELKLWEIIHLCICSGSDRKAGNCMNFIHLTDTHIRKRYDADETGSVLGTLPDPADNVRQILSGTDWDNIDFVAVTGDLVHEGTAEDYMWLKQVMAETVPAGTEVLYALGNHDHKKAFYQGFFDTESDAPYYYVRTLQGYRLIVLDSAVAGKESGTIVPEELEWLKRELAAPSEKGTILFLHHPIFWTSGASMSMALTNGAEVMEVLKGSDVFAIFCGHTHTNAVQTKEGIIQYTADSAAFSIERRSGGILAFTDKTGYLTALVDDERTIQTHLETAREDHAALLIPMDVFAEQLKKMDE